VPPLGETEGAVSMHSIHTRCCVCCRCCSQQPELTQDLLCLLLLADAAAAVSSQS
jgi:hypothetical protein